MKFYECKACGNIMVLIDESGVIPECCGSPMEEIIPSRNDETKEKHVPIINIEGCKVTISISSKPHPMEDVHYIKWVVLETDMGFYIRRLLPGNKPEVIFNIKEDEKVLTAYEYCNLHSLWCLSYDETCSC